MTRQTLGVPGLLGTAPVQEMELVKPLKQVAPLRIYVLWSTLMPEESTEEVDPSLTELEAAGEAPVDESTPAATTPIQDRSTEEVAPPSTELEGTTGPMDAKADEDEAVIGSLLDDADVGEVKAEEAITKQQTAKGDAECEEKEDSPFTENNEEVKTPVEATPASSGKLSSQVPTEPPTNLPSANNTATPTT